MFDVSATGTAGREEARDPGRSEPHSLGLGGALCNHGKLAGKRVAITLHVGVFERLNELDTRDRAHTGQRCSTAASLSLSCRIFTSVFFSFFLCKIKICHLLYDRYSLQ